MYQLAKTLRLPNVRLLQISGNTIARDKRLGEHALRFAAQSESVGKLSDEEQDALEEFVKYLGEK